MIFPERESFSCGKSLPQSGSSLVGTLREPIEALTQEERQATGRTLERFGAGIFA